MPFRPKDQAEATTALGSGAVSPPQEEPTPEAENPNGAEASSSEADASAEHFAGFKMDPDGEFGEAGADPDADPDAASGIIPFDEWFRTVFVGLFQGGGAFTGLETLQAVTADRRDAEGAARAIYDTALEVPSLRFLIQPGNKWVGRAFAIGMFALPLAGGCRVEIAAKRKAKAAESAKTKRERAQRSPGGDEAPAGAYGPETGVQEPDGADAANVVDLDWVKAT